MMARQVLRRAINVIDFNARHAAMINRAFAQHAGRAINGVANHCGHV